MFSETFKGYCMAVDGTYRDPIEINSEQELKKFLDDNVEKHYELRVTDSGDNLCFHVVDKKLIFPIPKGGSQNNMWNNVTKRFETQL